MSLLSKEYEVMDIILTDFFTLLSGKVLAAFADAVLTDTSVHATRLAVLEHEIS